MIKALIWNIRSVKSHRAFQRVQMLHNFHKFGFIALLEPFQQVATINRYKRRLKAPEAFHNTNGQIWVFVNNGFNATVISNSNQQLSLKLHNLDMDLEFTVTIVY